MKKNSTPTLGQSCFTAPFTTAGKSNNTLLKITLLLLIGLVSFGKLSAQYSGTISLPSGSFTGANALRDMIDSLNQYGLGGNLTVTVTAAQTAPTDGYSLGSTALNSSMAGKTLVFNGGGNVITAQTGTRSTTSTLAGSGNIDFIWCLRGTDNVTINNFVFTDPTANNTSAVNAMEAAVACFNMGSASGTADGCQNIFVTNNTFNFHNIATYSNCVWVTPYLRWSTTLATWGAPEDQHRNINITGNTMNEGYNFCMVRGSTTLDMRLPVVRINNNTVYKQGGGTVACYGLGTYYVDSVQMNDNVVFQDSLQSTTSYQLYPYFYGGYGETRNNQVTLNRGTTSSITNYGIYSYFYNYGSQVPHDSRYIIRGNNIDFKYGPATTTTTGGTHYGIYSYNYTYNTSDATNKRSLGIIDSNKIENDTIAGSPTFYGYFIISSGNPNAFAVKFADNKIENIVRTGNGGTTYGLYSYGFSDSAIYERNVIRNFKYSSPATTMTNSATFYGVGGYWSVAGTKPSFRNNIIENCGFDGLYSSTFNNVYGFGIISTTLQFDLNSNKIRNLYVKSTTTGGGNVYGIYGGSVVNNFNIRNNVLDSFYVTTTSTGTTGNTAGIYNASGTTNDRWTIFNNYIGDLISPAASSTVSMHGIYNGSTVVNMDVINNTIRIGRTGAVASSSAGFGGAGIYFQNATTGILNLKNNIIDINATPGSSGNFACVKRGSGTHGTKPANFFGNNNTYNMNSGTRNYYYCEGTSTSVTNGYAEWATNASSTNDGAFDGPCSAYKGFMQGEVFTVSNAETWAAGPVPNTFRPSGASLSESSAEPLALISTDLNGAGRGATPDRGALQFSGTSSDIFAPQITYSDITNVFCSSVGVSLSAEITDNSGVNTSSGTRPRLYYKKSTDANSFSAGNTSAGNGWKWVEASNTSSPFVFNMDYSIINGGAGTVTIGTIINYFVIAQDQVGTPNVGAVAGAFTPAGQCPTSVNVSGNASITGINNTKSFTITTPPAFGVQRNPLTTTCQGDTVNLMVIMPNPSATFPNYTASLGGTTTTNGFPSQTTFFDIDTVQINSFINATACAGGGSTTAINTLPASITGRYSNFTTTPVVDLIGGTTATWKLVLNVINTASTYNYNYVIYIDYNRNGVFELPAELVTTNLAAVTRANTTTTCTPLIEFAGTFNVPVNITSGPTLMRVMSNAATTAFITSPTMINTYGETEDYNVNLIAAPPASSSTHAWTTNKTGTTILGTTNPIRLPSYDTTTIYTDTMKINGCPFIVKDTMTVNPAPRKLQVFNSTQCGAGVPPISFKVRDSNGYTFPVIEWYSAAAGGTLLQSGIDTIYTSVVGSTTTMYVSIQNPSTGCWSARSPITITVTASDSILGRANGVRDTFRLCQGIPMNLTAVNVQSGGATKSFDTFTWSGNIPGVSFPLKNTTGSQTINPSVGGNYRIFVDALDTGTMCAARDTLNLVIQNNPFAGGQAFIDAAPNPACANTPITHSLRMANSLAVMPTYSLGTAPPSNATLGWIQIDTFQLDKFLSSANCTGITPAAGPAANGLPASTGGTTGGFYQNYTSATALATLPSPAVLKAGANVNYTVKLSTNTTSSTGWGSTVAMFIDYNRNGIIEPATERVVNSPNVATTVNTTCTRVHTVSGTIAVPTNIISGPTLCRVMTGLNSPNATTIASANANPNGMGETEDYIVTLIGAADTNQTKLTWTSSNTGTTVLGTNHTLIHPVTVNNQIYKVRMVNGLCIDSLRDTISTAVPPLTLNTIVGGTSACTGEQIKLSVTSTGGCIPHTYAWSMLSGAGTITNLGTGNLRDSINFLATGVTGARTVRCIVTDNTGSKDTSDHVISFNNPTPSAVVKDTICGLNNATLCATSSVTTDILRWYSSPTSFVTLQEGNCYTTPALNQETVFYVRQFTSVIDSCNPFNSANIFGILNTIYGDEFTVNKRLIVNSVDVYPFAASASTTTPATVTARISILDASGTEVFVSPPQTFNNVISATAAAASTNPGFKFPLGASLAPGVYRMFFKDYTGPSGWLYRSVAAVLPVSTPSNSLTVTRGVDNGGGSYPTINFYFWNWQVEEGCWGDATPDTVKYLAPPVLTLSRRLDSVCSLGSTTPVTLTSPSPLSTYNKYTWTPSTAISGDSSIGYIFSETAPATHTYVLSASQTSGLMCATTDTFRFKVKPIPPVISRNPTTASVDICNGSIQQLDALGFRLTNHVVGTATTTGAGVGQTPFMGGWGGTKSQFIIRASELPAGGTPKTLKSIAMRATSAGTTYEGFQIYVGHTTLAQFTAPGDINPITGAGNTPAVPLTRVYEANAALAAYTPITTGTGFNNVFTFGTKPTTPLGGAVSDQFLWDGVSNIVVFMSWSENPTAATSTASNFEYSNPGFTASMRRQDDNQSMSNMAISTGGTVGTATSRPNMQFVFEDGAPITWSPTTSLFTNAGATTAYTGTNRDTVFAKPSDTIKYYVTATFPNSCTRRDSITINVKDSVSINTQPPSFAAFCAGDTMKICIGASSTSPITYQWKKNGLNISTALNASAGTSCLIIPNSAPSDSGTYEVDLSTGAPCTDKTSISSLVKIRIPIIITTQPKDTTVCVGSPMAVIADASNDSSRMWTQIGGSNTGTTDVFSKGGSVYSDSGRYFITYYPNSPCPAKNSDTVTVKVLPPAMILTDPATLTNLCIGDSTTLKATYQGALGFQWLKNGVAIPAPAGTRDSLVVKANTQADSGIYQLVVKAAVGCTPDTSAVTAGIVKVNLPVVITTQPLAHTYVCQNSPFNASVTASNTTGYQWEKDMVTIFTGTNASFTIPSTQPSDAGVFRVLVKGIAPCPDVYSTNDTLTVTTLAAMTVHPTAFQVCEDQSISITGTATNAASYQWLFNGSPISAPNGTMQTYTKGGNPATMADSGRYRVIALSSSAGATACKSDTSNEVLGAVVRKIAITTQPLAKTFVCQNSMFNADIVAQNVTGYQWRKDGVDVSIGTGGTSANYSIASTQPSAAGVYNVEMTGISPCPNVTSTNDTLAVTTLAAMTVHPTAFQVCEDQSISITGTATNAASYQWLFNGSPISAPNGTAQTYTKGGGTATMSDSGMYRVVALSSNAGATACKADTSNEVLGAVVRKIAITTQPLANTFVCQNSAFNTSIVAQNVASYQWKKNGTNVSIGTGGTSANYSIASTQPGDAGVYTVEMVGTSPCPNVTSTTNTLAVTTLAAITTPPASGTVVCETQGFTLNTAATNAASYQWLRNSSPVGTNSTSYSIGSAAMVDSAYYRVVALSSNAGATTCKADTSADVLVTVNRAIQITTQPASFSYGCIGAQFTLNVVANYATGYTWRKGGTANGQTTSTMTINPFGFSDTGNYDVIITGRPSCPNVTSGNAKVDPTTAAFVTVEPAANTDVCLNGALNLSVTGQAAQTYQWRKNGVNIPGAINNTYSISPVGYGDAATYDVILVAYFGCTNDTSANAVVTVSTPLAITTPLANSDVKCEGQNISYTTGVSGTSPYTYTWKLNGSTVGTNNANYAKNGVMTSDSGKYVVSILGSAACPMIYDTLDLDINRTPVVTVAPNGPSPICLGTNSTLNVTTVDHSSIEWHKTGVGNTGQTGTIFNITNALTADAGSYFVIAKAQPACSDVTSGQFTIAVNTPATVALHPTGAAILEDPAGSHTLNVIAAGTGPFSYQWYRQGNPILGANSASYAITNYVPTLDSGTYYCKITAPAPCNNTVNSNTARILTIKCPAIVSNPVKNVSVCAGGAFSLDVTATGVKSYQWFKGTTAIPGATFANFSIPNAKPSNSGVYRCRLFAFNDATCDITYTDSAVVVVKDQPIITKQPMGISSCAVSTHTMTVEATYGETYQWYRNGIAISPNGDGPSYTYNNVNLLGDEFYVKVGNNLCSDAVSDKIVLKSVNPASQVYLTGSTVFNLVERCEDANGWTYYSTSAQSEQLLMAIKKNGNNFTARPDIELMGNIREISPINNENRGVILGSALFNLDIQGSVVNPYEVKFFYSKTDADLLISRFNQIRLANSGNFSTDRVDLTFILSTQRSFTSQLWTNMTVPVNFDHTISHKDKEFGTENNVHYVILKNLVSPKLGGTAFMDYKLKSSSRITSTNANGFGFSMYPVPTTDGKVTVDVSSKRLKPITFTVTDMTGRVIAVFNEKHTSLESSHAFDFSQLANGNYQLMISNDEESAIGKFTISK